MGLQWCSWTKNRPGDPTYGTEKRRLAPETFMRLDHGHADTVRQLGYLGAFTLRLWWETYARTGSVPLRKAEREPRLSVDERRCAVGYHLDHGRCISKTLRELGYPGCHKLFCQWADELAPGLRRRHKQKPAGLLAPRTDERPPRPQPPLERRAS